MISSAMSLHVFPHVRPLKMDVRAAWECATHSGWEALTRSAIPSTIMPATHMRGIIKEGQQTGYSPLMDEFKSVQALPTRDELSARFPRQARSILARSFWFLLAGLFAVVAYLVLAATPLTSAPAGLEAAILRLTNWILLITVLIVAIKLLYEVVYFLMFSYAIELEHLTITKGVFFRSRSSFPMAKVNDVSIQRSPIELLFGLYAINVLTASPVSTYGRVGGLNRRNAASLQAFLLALVETTLPDVKEAAAERIARTHLSADEADVALHTSAR